MNLVLFEPFREWVYITRRRKGSKKPLKAVILGGTRVRQEGGHPLASASDEINWRLEPAHAEFIAKQRSSEASWFNIKQLTEPLFYHG